MEEDKVYAFNHKKKKKWTFTSNDTSASILSVLDMALSEFDVLRYDFILGKKQDIGQLTLF